MSRQNKNNSPLFCNESPWNNVSNNIWIGSTISLNRNLDKFKFPGKLTIDKKKQIISLLTRNFLESDQLKNPQIFTDEEMPHLEKEFLVEHFLSHQSFQHLSGGEAFILDATGTFLGLLNFKDHIFLQYIDFKEELEKTWDSLVKIELDLNKSMNFAFSPRFGFLTSDPANCGTGLVIQVFLHLPALIYSDRLEEILKKSNEEGIVQTGLQGNPHELIGDIVVFHNNYSLGVTEENIVSSLRTLAIKLVTEEKSIRKQLANEKEVEIATMKDSVSRAYAILLHSYQIEAVEALEALSLLKLGLDLEWIKGSSHAILNHLLFSSRRAHLLCHYNQNISQDELPHKRAEFIHKALKGVELLI